MSTFLDGPAAGVTLLFARSPVYLRVVLDTLNGGWDVLDQLDDNPAPFEEVFVYRRLGPAMTAHVNRRGSGKPSGWYEIADYVHVSNAPGDELRDNAAWHAWVEQTHAAHVDGALEAAANQARAGAAVEAMRRGA